jgi:hypothetical protein
VLLRILYMAFAPFSVIIVPFGDGPSVLLLIGIQVG